MSSFFAVFMCFQLRFVIFCQKEISAKAVSKMFVNMTTVVNFTNILCAAFVPIFVCQKLQIQKVSREKPQKDFHLKKLFVKC